MKTSMTDAQRAEIIKGRLKAMSSDNSPEKLGRIFQLDPRVVRRVLGLTPTVVPITPERSSVLDRMFSHLKRRA